MNVPPSPVRRLALAFSLAALLGLPAANGKKTRKDETFQLTFGEDETGLGSAILSPAVARSQRAALHAAPVLLATGRVQRRGATTSLLVQTIVPWAASGQECSA